MLNLSRFKPSFWDHRDAASGPGDEYFSFRRKWLMIIVFTTIVTLTPLFVMAVVDYRLTLHAFESETTMAVSQSVSNNCRNVSFILSQRIKALLFIARDNSLEDLTKPGRLNSILDHLQWVTDGFVDLMVVDADGLSQAYAGPRSAKRGMPKPAAGFEDDLSKGIFISDVKAEPGQGHRLVIAIRHILNNGDFFVLQTKLDAGIFEGSMLQLSLKEADDAFIVNRRGVLQAPGRFHGSRYEKIAFPLPDRFDGTRVLKTMGPNGKAFFLGVSPIAESPFLFVMVRPESGIMDLWLKPRIHLVGLLLVSIATILASIVGGATYLVNRIHAADRRRVQALHQVEYANKMTSIGRLASGVAHEVNNPLAIINQKTGLIKDLITMHQGTAGNGKILGLVNDVLESVKRCGAITRRMLNFARHMESSIEEVDLESIIRQVLAFMEKEAQRRSISINVSIEGKIPAFRTDRGNTQQIILNLVNNAFAAMEDGGNLDLHIKREGTTDVCVSVSDTGHGIPTSDLKRVFEPFFSTRQGHAGTGLGLSVTYGMVSEMGGRLSVESEVNHGTRFTVTLPLTSPKTRKRHDG